MLMHVCSLNYSWLVHSIVSIGHKQAEVYQLCMAWGWMSGGGVWWGVWWGGLVGGFGGGVWWGVLVGGFGGGE